MAAPKNSSLQNRILACLPAADLARLRPRLEAVELPLRLALHQPMTPMRHAYFPEQGLISAVTTLEDGRTIEVATVGEEGFTGLPILNGVESMPQRYFVQIEGHGWRISAQALREAAGPDTELRQQISRYHTAFMTQIMQSVACNGLHSIEQRCCRWLLRCSERAPSSDVAITQEFLAQMLGVRRASVTDVLRPMQASGLIRHRRGVVSVLDRDRLAESACECYHMIRREFDRLLRCPD